MAERMWRRLLLEDEKNPPTHPPFFFDTGRMSGTAVVSVMWEIEIETKEPLYLAKEIWRQKS